MGNKKVTLTIDGLDSNQKKSSTKIQYVNPNASDDVMRTFANKCAALSTDTHTATTKTTDEDITTAETPKPKLTLEVDSTELAKLAVTSEGTSAEFAHVPIGFRTNDLGLYTVSLIWDDNGQLYVFDPTAPTSRYIMAGYVSTTSFGAACRFVEEGSHGFDGNLTVDFYFSETNTTAATHYQLTITKTAGQATFVQL